ncbi:MAG: 4Fe-4S binding protein [Methanobacterium sp.]
MSIIEGIKNKYADYRLAKVNALENSVREKEGCLTASLASPEKLMPDKLKITLKTLPKQLSIAKNMELTVKSLRDNPENPKIEAENDFIIKFENYAESIGIDNIGYVKVPSDMIFKDKAILYENAIVLIMEMDKEAIDAVPSETTQEMGIITYDELGKKTNSLAEFLRENGFGAHASHPAGGIVMYPHLAQMASLGHRGRHGMLLTPEFGPRQRISVIFTSIQNFPVKKSNEHLWIPDFCAKCGKCIRTCPGNAIIEKNGKTKIIKDSCHGCTICMRDCNFNRTGYAKIKNRHN